MALSQLQLEAFVEVARTGGFTAAAAKLNLTQSALSHRIKNLEQTLEAALFTRHAGGARLTEAGERLLRFCRVQAQAEEEFLREARTPLLAGTLRVGGASSLMRPLVLPALAPVVRDNPEVRLEFWTRELRELPALLARGHVDFLVTCGEAPLAGVVETQIGFEENVLVQSARKGGRRDVYLDHDPEDQTTFAFLKANGKGTAALERVFLDDIYGILDGVSLGLGRAVIPRHLSKGRRDLEVVRGFKPVRTPVYLYWMKQPYYTRLHQVVAAALGEIRI